jgi:hypothetical protein
MKIIKRPFAILIVILLLTSSSFNTASVIPVFDFLKFVQDEIAHILKMLKLAKIIETIRTIKQIENETKDFFNNIYSAIKGSDLISAKDLLWQILNSTYLRDKFKNDPWWVVWQTEVKLSEIFPELLDFSYITNSYLYENNPEHREYGDKVIAHLQEKAGELENLKEHMKLMRKAYEKNIEQINLFNNRLEEYAKDNHTGRLIALTANLELMNARLNLTLNFNRRVMMTLLLKEDTWNMVNFNREVTREYWEIEK